MIAPSSAAREAQKQVTHEQRPVRAENVVIVRDPKNLRTRVLVDGTDLQLPPNARVHQTFLHNKPHPLVTIQIQSRRVQILSKNVDAHQEEP